MSNKTEQETEKHNIAEEPHERPDGRDIYEVPMTGLDDFNLYDALSNAPKRVTYYFLQCVAKICYNDKM